jgi:2'-5' RNA ligase
MSGGRGSTVRMFVAVVPPERVAEELEAFLEPREGMPWIAPEQWHLTLAFMPAVPEHRVDDLADGLAERFGRNQAFAVRLRGAGCFPSPDRASVLWLGVDPAAGERLAALSTNARNVAASVGAAPDGRAFLPHLTLARLRRPVEATKWLRVLDAFASSTWTVDEVSLVASHLGEGPHRRPRHEVVASVRLGSTSDGLRDRLRSGLRGAMRARDRDAVAAIRSALSAVDNAEAVPLDPADHRHRAGAIEGAAVGLGAAEVERRSLSEEDVIAIVLSEVQEREHALAVVADTAPDRVETIRAELDALRAFLD